MGQMNAPLADEIEMTYHDSFEVSAWSVWCEVIRFTEIMTFFYSTLFDSITVPKGMQIKTKIYMRRN